MRSTRDYVADEGIFSALAVGVLRVRFDGPLPSPPTSLWRSALGHALHEAVCVTRQPHCTGCLLRPHCAYSRLFEPDAPPRAPPFGSSDSPPTPYAMLNETVSGRPALQLRLFGAWAQAQTLLLLAALRRAGQAGFGRERRRYVASQAEVLGPDGRWHSWQRPAGAAEGLPAPPACTTRIRVQLLSPLRLQRDGCIVCAGRFAARDFGLAVLRRIQLLAWAHGQGPEPVPPLAALDDLDVGCADLCDQWGSRYSARQHRRLPLNGLTGSFELIGDGLPALWPWLWAGQWTQAGKSATQGLGAYRVHVVLEAT